MAVEIERSSLDNSFDTKLKLAEKSGKVPTNEDIKPIVSKDKIVTTKKSLGSKLKESFFSEDAKDIGDYILNDVIIPGIKDTILSSIERMFGYGSGSRRDRYRDYDRTSYSSYYRSKRDNRDRERDRDRDDDKIDYRNIVLKERADAEEIADKMNYYIHEYDSVSVAMLLDLIDLPGKYTDNNWGWTREGDIRVRRVRNGYLIDVPEAVYIGD